MRSVAGGQHGEYYNTLGGDFPGVYPGTTLFPLLLNLSLAGGELGALEALPCQCCGCCGASCKETGIMMDSALSQPGCTPRAPTGFAAQVWEPHEPTQSPAGSEEQPWQRGSPGMLGWCSIEPECKIITCVSLHTCASVFSPT